MPETFEAVAVLGFALLPGATFIWATERITGAWGARAVDRVLRFIALSLGLHVIASPLTFWLWRTYIQSGELAEAKGVPLSVYEFGLLYLLGPFAAGTLVGHALLDERGWARFLFGLQGRPPRAWDYAWSGEPAGYVRLLVKTDPPMWIAGLLGTRGGRTSYVAAYPEDQDIYLAGRLKCNSDTGELLPSGDQPEPLPGGILIRWDEVLYLEIIDREQ